MANPWTSAASLSLERGAVTLIEDSIFCISDDSGDLHDDRPQGLFVRDTRVLSRLGLSLDEEPLELLTGHQMTPFQAVFAMRPRPHRHEADSPLLVFREREVGRGLGLDVVMRERIVVHNYGQHLHQCRLVLDFESDFADVFDVKQGRRTDVDRDIRFGESRITFSKTLSDAEIATTVDFSTHPRRDGQSAVFEVVVQPAGEWALTLTVRAELDHHGSGSTHEPSPPEERLAEWLERLPKIPHSNHVGVRLQYEQSTRDLASLRLADPRDPEHFVIAAGAPWFMTMFGRDSLITSWMALLIDPTLALTTLRTLADSQGADVNPVTQEEPGKIMHEMRLGESARLLGGGGYYYGTVDATPLFVMLLGELRRWGCEREALMALVPAADRAMEWITTFGDRDGDGFVEYDQTGKLRNQGWKDALDGIQFSDGRIAEPPVALCEVQGYVYAALLARADFADDDGDAESAAALRSEAAELKKRFNEVFWVEDRGWLALGLDRDKRQIDALTSNMGHCLWTGILDDDKAAAVAERLVAPELFSGWGIRTMASNMEGFNPVSYQRGSVWPHDTAICAAGLMRYGFEDEAQRVIRGLVDAGEHFNNRLSELFAGTSRDDHPFPIGYPTACSPQAWASASPLLLLRTLLGLEPDVPAGVVHCAARLPAWISELEISAIPIARGELSVTATHAHVDVSAPADLRVSYSAR